MGIIRFAVTAEFCDDDDVSTDFSPPLSQAVRPTMNAVENKTNPDFFLNRFIDFIKRLSFIDIQFLEIDKLV
ncbi:hypothetical protein [Nitrosomonas sp. wSCUT-2]